MRTTVITGSASGMGAATRARLLARGERVIGVDQRDADIVADLSTREGREHAISEVGRLSGGAIDALVTFAGIAGLPGRPGSLLVSVNYFGTVELLLALRPLLAAGDRPCALAISSNSTATQPGLPVHITELLLAGDEARARKAADDLGMDFGSVMTYPATKLAVARWVRRHAPTDDWIGAGITLNAVAPGYVETPMTEEGKRDPVLAQALASFRVPAGHGKADQLAALVEFLLGPDARYFCGSVIFCDGGTDAETRPDDWPSPRQ